MAACETAVAVKGRPLVGVLPELLRHPAEYCRRVALEHGGALLRLNLGAGSAYLATRPEHVEHILSTNIDNYWKGRIFNRIRFVFGEGLLLSEGAEWSRQRRLLQPAFNARRVRSMIPRFCDLIARRLATWESARLRDRPLNIAEEMRVITMRVGAAAMFSKDVSDPLSDSIAAAFEVLLKNAPMRFFTFFLPEWIAVPGQRQTERAIRRVDRFVYALAEERRKHPGEEGDLLSLLSAAVEQEAEGESRERARQLLRDHVVTTLFAGYESTSTALTWVWCLLSRHPEVARRVKAEVDAVLGQREPSFEDLARLEYTQMVVEETLRLYPPFWESFRSAYDEDEIAGIPIPAGASFILCPYATQRDPRSWPNPDAFDPERFRAGGRPHHRYAYFPFLEGQRACIGKAFALAEIKLVIALAIRDYQLTLAPGFVLESRAQGTLRPRHVPWMTLDKH
jgi:cytochrome P450